MFESNLVRDHDLAFETDLLYLDVTNGRLGVKTASPGNFALDVNGNTRITGDLTVQGTTTTVDSQNLAVEDNLIVINSSGSVGHNSGVMINRGSEGNNAVMIWDESTDKFKVGTTTSDGSTTSDFAVTLSAIQAAEPTASSDVATKNYVDNQVSAGGVTTLADADSDTQIEVERTADEDQIHFQVGGTDAAHIRSNGNIELNNLQIADTTISTLSTNGDLTLTPNGTGKVIVTDGTTLQTNTADINGGAIDGTVIGANSAAAGTFTTIGTSGNVTIGGDLTVNGTTTTVATTNTVVSDTLLELGNGTTGAPANDAGIVIERGDSNNAFIGFDESADKFIVGTGTFTGASTGNLTITTGTLVANLEATTATVGGSNVTTTDNTQTLTNKTFDANGTGNSISNIDFADFTSGVILDEDNMASDSATNLATQQSIKAYVDAETANVASDTLTLTNKTFDANGTGNSISNIDIADFTAGVFLDEDNMASNSATAIASQQSIKAYVDAETANIASDTLTLTNKTFDANGTGNSISNIEVADFASGVLDTDLSSVSGSDDTLASAKAIKAYVDAEVSAVSTTTISEGNSSVDVDDGAGGAGQVIINVDGNNELVVNDTSATFSGNVVVTGDLTVNGTTTTVATTNTTVTDSLVEYSNGTTGAPANDAGIVIERGDENNAFIGFDESEDKFIVGTGTFTGASTGNLTITTGTLVANLEGNVTGNVTGTVSDISNHLLDEDNMATDSATKAPSQQSVKAYVDAQDANIASDTLTFTNKTFDANGTGNSISNIDIADFTSGVFLDEDNMASDSATAIASQQSIKAYVDAQDANIASDTLTFTNKTFDANGTGNSISNIETADFASAAFKDEDNMASDSATAVASQQSIKAYVDAETANVASDTLTLTNKTFDANGTGNSISNLEVADFAGSAIINVSETLASNDSDTALVTAGAIIDYVDAQDANIASDTLTFTNKTFDANGTGNSISNIEVADLASGVLDTDLSSVSASDDTLASAKAIKAYVDAQVTAQDLDFQADSGGALSIDLDSETLTFTGGTGIDTSGSGNAVTFAIDSTVTTLTGTQTLTNKTLTTPVISSISNTGALTLPTSTDTLVGRATTDTLTNKTFDANGTGNSISNIETADFASAAFKDEDNMASDSATAVASQQSIKAYVDAETANVASDTLTFTNKTFDANGTGNSITNIEVADLASGVLDTDISSASASDDTLASAKAIKAYVDDQVSAGSTTSISEGNSSVDVDDGAGGAGQVVINIDGNNELVINDTSATFSGNVIMSGDLTVNGTTTTVATTNTTVADNIIELNSGISASSNDSGILIERGSTGDNAFIGWDESADKFTVGTTTATAGDKSGGITVTKGTLVADLEGDVTGTVSDISNHLLDEDNMATDSATKAPSQQSVKAYVDTQDANIAGDTLTFTNKTFDANGTGNSISNIEVADLASGVVDTDISSVSASDDTLASAKAIKTYVDAQDANIASDTLTLTNKTFDANGTGNSITNIEVADFAGTAIINVAETLASNDSDTALVTAGAIIDYVDAQDANIASDTLTLTNKTIDANGTGNVISNIDIGNMTAASIVLESEGIASNDNDTTLPTSAAVKDFVDTAVGAVSTTAITQLNTSATVSDSGSNGAFTVVADGNTELVINDTSATFSGDVIMSGNLTVNGTTTTVSTTNTVVSDTLLELGNGTTGSPANDAGIVIERGDSNNAFIGFDESADKFIVGTGTFTGASTGDLTITTGTLVANLEATTATVGGSNVTTTDNTQTLTNKTFDANGTGNSISNIDFADFTSGVILDEDNMASDSATNLATQQSIKTYVDAETANVASDTLTLTNKTFDANGTGNSLSNVEVADFAGSAIITVSETLASNDSDTALVTAGAIIDYVDAQDANIASDTLTFTNKTFDANGTGNSLSNVEVADFASGVVDTDISSVSASDDTLASAKAIKTYVDAQVSAVSTTSISEGNSSVDVDDGAGGAGQVVINIDGNNELVINDTSATFSGNVIMSGNLTVNGTTTTVNTTNTTISDNIIELNSGISASSNDAGILIERGSTGDNAFIGWDESADKFTVGTTTATAGDKSGGITVTTGTLVANLEGDVTGDVTGTVSDISNHLLDEDNMASDSATKAPSQQSVKAYVDAQDAAIASDTLTFTNKTFDANGTGNSITNIDFADFTTGVVLDEDNMASNSATNLATQQSIKAYVDAETANVASDTLTFTNKTFDANGTGNSITNIEVADFAGSAIINVSETLASNDSDTALVTAGAIIDYVDAQDANIASDTLTFTNKTFDANGTGNSLSNVQVADFASGEVLDEDNMASDSATKLATQQSIKAYVDTAVSAVSTTTISEGNSSVDVDDGAGGAGQVVVTVDGNTELTINDTSATFNGNVVITGDMTVNGTTTTIDSTTLTVEDPLIQLAKNNSGGDANTFDQGLFFNRGSLDNVSFIWDESADQFAFAVTSGEDGTTAGNITIDSYANVKANVITGADVETGTISAADGTQSATIANSTGVMTIASAVLTTADINGGTIDGATIGGATPAAGTFTNLTANGTIDIDSTGNMDGIIIGANTAAAGTFTTATATNVQATNIKANDGTAAIVITDSTGAVAVSTALTATGNVSVNGGTFIFNEAGADLDFRFEGDNNANLLFGDAGNDRIGILTATPAVTLDIGQATDGIYLPSGNTEARPTPVGGVIRYNSQTGQYEGSQDGSTWINFATAGAAPTFTKETATGDGSTTTFSGFFSSAPESANNVFVYIDNVYQEPTENYTVSGADITFTSAPHSGARIFAITGADNTALVTGGIARSETTAVSVSGSSATNIFTFNGTNYRSAECFITVQDSGNTQYSAMKATVIHDGSTAYGMTYAVTNTAAQAIVDLSFNYNGGTIEVKATPLNSGTQSIKVQYSLASV